MSSVIYALALLALAASTWSQSEEEAEPMMIGPENQFEIDNMAENARSEVRELRLEEIQLTLSEVCSHSSKFPNVQVLSLLKVSINIANEDSIASLPDGCFSNLTKLTRFEMIEMDGLVMIGNAFDGLKHLTEIIFMDNVELQLTNSVFSSTHNLKRLTIINSNMDDAIPEQVGNLNIEFIHLTGLRVIPTLEFNAMAALRTVIITQNSLPFLYANIINSTSLQNLTLTFNDHSNIHERAFELLPNLLLINLSNNQLFYLHPNTFSGCPMLKSVDLSSNKFQTLEQRLLPWSFVATVKLHKNPWRCDCLMARSFMRMLAISRSLMCTEPANMRGTLIGDLNEAMMCTTTGAPTSTTRRRFVTNRYLTAATVRRVGGTGVLPTRASALNQTTRVRYQIKYTSAVNIQYTPARATTQPPPRISTAALTTSRSTVQTTGRQYARTNYGYSTARTSGPSNQTFANSSSSTRTSAKSNSTTRINISSTASSRTATSSSTTRLTSSSKSTAQTATSSSTTRLTSSSKSTAQTATPSSTTRSSTRKINTANTDRAKSSFSAPIAASTVESVVRQAQQVARAELEEKPTQAKANAGSDNGDRTSAPTFRDRSSNNNNAPQDSMREQDDKAIKTEGDEKPIPPRKDDKWIKDPVSGASLLSKHLSSHSIRSTLINFCIIAAAAFLRGF